MILYNTKTEKIVDKKGKDVIELKVVRCRRPEGRIKEHGYEIHPTAKEYREFWVQ